MGTRVLCVRDARMELSRSFGFAYVSPFFYRFTIIVLGVLGEEKRYTLSPSVEPV